MLRPGMWVVSGKGMDADYGEVVGYADMRGQVVVRWVHAGERMNEWLDDPSITGAISETLAKAECDRRAGLCA